nr:MmgE/PrpD family protein [Comamonas sp.]
MKQESHITIHPLAQFAATLHWDDIPPAVQRKAEDLWVDWFGSVLAGQNARPVQSLTRFALSQGPAQGPCEVIGQNTTTSPMMAALANAAAAHVAEQDDVHNGSVFHPAAVVFAPAVAVAQSMGASGAQLMAACVAGYEVGIRVGEFLGRSHYRIFHTTGT